MGNWSKNLVLTHWGRVMPNRRQTIIWTNAEILLIGPLGTNFSEILIEIHKFSFKKCVWKWRLENGGHFCLGLIVLNTAKGCNWMKTTWIWFNINRPCSKLVPVIAWWLKASKPSSTSEQLNTNHHLRCGLLNIRLLVWFWFRSFASF